MNKKAFSIIGGDKRNLSLKKILEEDGNKVKLFGFSNYTKENINNSLTLEEAIKDTDYIITGTPFTCDNVTLISPFENKEIKILDLLNLVNKNQILLGGYIPKDISKKLLHLIKEKQIKVIDILDREEMNLLNAIPTAEGAIKIAIEETDITINNSNVMVIGHGRIGKILSRILNSMGANVFVVVNKDDAFAEVKTYNYLPIMFNNLNKYLSNMNIIFNTVPETILDKKNIKYLNKDCLVIDLSSPPFGVDCNFCKKNSIKALWARSLPGRIAPKTVAIYMKETIYNIIKEIGGY